MTTLSDSSTQPLAAAKAHLSAVVMRVREHHERITLTVNGVPSAVLLAPEDLESLLETIDVLSDPVTMDALAVSRAEHAAGLGVIMTKDEMIAAVQASREAEQLAAERTAARKPGKSGSSGKSVTTGKTSRTGRRTVANPSDSGHEIATNPATGRQRAAAKAAPKSPPRAS
jgi:antitoxin YefM